MKLKTLTITVAVLAGLCLAAWFATKPPAPAGADPRVGQPLVSADTVTAAARLRLTDQGKTVQLEKQADNTWRVASYHDFPADFGKLSGLVHDLTEAKVERFVTAKPERFKRLEFKDTAITLQAADGKELWKLTLGKNADTGGRFIHFDDEERAYLTRLNAWIDAEPRNWADSALLRFKPDDIAKVEIDFPGTEPVVVHRAKPGDEFAADAPAGKRLKVAEVANLLRSLGELRFTDTTAKDDPEAAAAAAHTRNVQLTTFGGESYALSLGRKPESRRPKPVAAPQPATNSAAPQADKPPADAAPAKPGEPEYETVPAGPVFAVVHDSDAKAAVNAMMAKRTFKVADYAFTSLPAKREDLFEPIPPPTATAVPPAATPAAPASHP